MGCAATLVATQATAVLVATGAKRTNSASPERVFVASSPVDQVCAAWAAVSGPSAAPKPPRSSAPAAVWTHRTIPATVAAVVSTAGPASSALKASAALWARRTQMASAAPVARRTAMGCAATSGATRATAVLVAAGAERASSARAARVTVAQDPAVPLGRPAAAGSASTPGRTSTTAGAVTAPVWGLPVTPPAAPGAAQISMASTRTTAAPAATAAPMPACLAAVSDLSAGEPQCRRPGRCREVLSGRQCLQLEQGHAPTAARPARAAAVRRLLLGEGAGERQPAGSDPTRRGGEHRAGSLPRRTARRSLPRSLRASLLRPPGARRPIPRTCRASASALCAGARLRDGARGSIKWPA